MMSMPDVSNKWVTRWSVIAGIKDPNNDARWTEFYELYSDLIFAVAMKSGLREHEAQDVVQETMKSVARNIGEFDASPGRGSFRSWLLQLARWRIEDQRAKRLPVSAGEAPTQTGVTSTVERVPDPAELDVHVYDAEWRKALLNEALRRLQLKVKAQQYQVFYLLEMDGKNTSEVAAMTGMSAARVYLERHRVRLKLKNILASLNQEIGEKGA